MADETLSAALKEAYASAPADVIVYHTLELRHDDFTAPIRVVRDVADLDATLEATAPEDASTEVRFTAFAFELTKPEITTAGVPQLTIEIDNVSRVILAQLEATVGSANTITVIYREFISSDLSGPQNDPPMELTINSISADVFRIRATASFGDYTNRKFPQRFYSSEDFPGLIPG